MSVKWVTTMRGKTPFALSLALVIAPLFAGPCVAQGRGGFHGSAAFASAYGTRHYGAGSFGRRRSPYTSGYFWGDLPFLYDDYPFSPAQPEQVGPQIIILQPPTANDPPRPKASPLLIELEGDRYVRYGGESQVSDSKTPLTARDKVDSDQISTPMRRSMAGRITKSPLADVDSSEPVTAAAAQITPTVLVYRDGHREEIPDYAIVGRVLYAHSGDAEGYGMRNIQISALDVKSTIEANHQHGVNFVLPTGPNEVVTRP